MPLDLRDLEDEKKRLNALIERAKDALGAIDKLIRMQEIDSLSDHRKSDIVTLSVEKAVKIIHQEAPSDWITGAQMEEKIMRRDPKRGGSLKTNIGNAQRRLLEIGFLERKDVGTETQEKFAYRVMDKGKEDGHH